MLFDNDIRGDLPSNWLPMPSLHTLLLSNNDKMGGTLPPSLFDRQPSLTVLVIEGTRLSGSLPVAALCRASSLRLLHLAGNKLTGPLPRCMTNLTRLEIIRVAFNKLDGELPPDIEVHLWGVALRTASESSLPPLTTTTNRRIKMARAVEAAARARPQPQSIPWPRGRVPAGLGRISRNLTTVRLEFNRLACELPHSVQRWAVHSGHFTVTHSC